MTGPDRTPPEWKPDHGPPPPSTHCARARLCFVSAPRDQKELERARPKSGLRPLLNVLDPAPRTSARERRLRAPPRGSPHARCELLRRQSTRTESSTLRIPRIAPGPCAMAGGRFNPRARKTLARAEGSQAAWRLSRVGDVKTTMPHDQHGVPLQANLLVMFLLLGSALRSPTVRTHNENRVVQENPVNMHSCPRLIQVHRGRRRLEHRPLPRSICGAAWSNRMQECSCASSPGRFVCSPQVPLFNSSVLSGPYMGRTNSVLPNPDTPCTMRHFFLRRPRTSADLRKASVGGNG